MRPQQNRRVNNKHRPNLNRKPQNPLSKTFESNGPGIKIRGNAQHIHEKYIALARDAQATGDNIVAENFLQHAEHYKRIILEATANQQIYNQEAHTAETNTETVEPFSPQIISENLDNASIVEPEKVNTVKKPNNKKPNKPQSATPINKEEKTSETEINNNKKPSKKSNATLKKRTEDSEAITT